jgi:hypothetical protein
MYTRDLVKRLFADAGLYRSSDPKLKTLLAAIDEQPLDCWPEFVARFRKEFYELFDRVVPPLINSGDRLIAAVLLHHADLSKPKERALITKYVQDADEQAAEDVLLQVARLDDAKLNRELAKKNLTPSVRAVLVKQSPAPRRPSNVTTDSRAAAPKTARKRKASARRAQRG